MKNFGTSYFFEKAIRIINPRILQQDSSIVKKKKYDIQFFPEGGNLVQQIETKVAFRVTDDFGRGLEFEGMLMNSAGDTVLRFHPLHKDWVISFLRLCQASTTRQLIRFPQGNTEMKNCRMFTKADMCQSFQEGPTGQVTAMRHLQIWKIWKYLY
jgi:hypothetical protein